MRIMIRYDHWMLYLFINWSTYFLRGIAGIAPDRVMQMNAALLPNSIALR